MPDNSQPAAVPDYTADIEQDAAADVFSKDVSAVLARVREAAQLPAGAEAEIEDHFTRKTLREMEQNNGQSESQARWHKRKENPLAWQETESQLIGEMMQKARRYREVPRCPDGHPAHRDLSPVEMSRMNDRDWENKKADERWYSELSADERKKFDASYAGRKGR